MVRLALSVCLLLVSPFAATAAPLRLDAGAWREDLAFLERTMESVHVDLHRFLPAATLRSEVRRVHEAIPELDDDAIVCELARIVACLPDGHSSLNLLQGKTGFRMLPVVGHSFADGYFIVRAMEGLEHLVGARVVRIEQTGIEDVFARIAPLISADNAYFDRHQAGFRILVPEVLRVLGLAPSADAVSWTVEKQGNEEVVVLKPEAMVEWSGWFRSEPRGLWPLEGSKKPAKLYDFVLHKETGTLVARVDTCVDQEGEETLAEFASRLKRFADRADFDRFVLDIRTNGGGSANNIVPLVQVIADHPKLDRRGRLYTATRAGTYSAAVLLCGMLENRTRTRFVGEPTGQGPNLLGDAKVVELPRSGLSVFLSERWWQCSLDEDTRDAFQPDIPVAFTGSDYFAGKDPLLPAILAAESAEEETPTGLPSRDRARYVGRYEFGPYHELRIRRRGDELSCEILDLVDGPSWLSTKRSTLYPDGARGFRTDIADVFLRPARGEGPAAELEFDWRGIPVRCRRLKTGEKLPVELADGGNIQAAPQGLTFRKGPSDSPRGLRKEDVIAGLDGLLAQRDVYRYKLILEQRLNILGYRFLRARDVETALRVFEANVTLFPRSWNVYDSLAEAQLRNGERELARQNYRRSVELNPENESGKKALAKLGD